MVANGVETMVTIAVVVCVGFVGAVVADGMDGFVVVVSVVVLVSCSDRRDLCKNQYLYYVVTN